jgi:hypothetical protein
MLIYTITFKITSIHGLIIDVVMAIDEIGRCTMVRHQTRSSKNQQRLKRKIRIPIAMDEMEDRISRLPTWGGG